MKKLLSAALLAGVLGVTVTARGGASPSAPVLDAAPVGRYLARLPDIENTGAKIPAGDPPPTSGDLTDPANDNGATHTIDGIGAFGARKE